MTVPARTLLVCESSTLVNFLRIGRADLLAGLEYRLLVTDVVRDEIKERYQSQQLESGIMAGEFEEVALSDLPELQDFAALQGLGLGRGESSSIVAAQRRGAVLAVDDNQAMKTAKRLFQGLDYRTTQELMVEAIIAGLLTIQDADLILNDWRQHHRFSLTIRSFHDLLPR